MEACPRPGWKLALLVSAVVFVALFFRLGHLPLLNPDEGRNAEMAREMKASGAWLVPTYNGVARLDKPSSYFKLVAHSLSVFGENETAARLPSALCGLGLLVILWGFVQRVHGSRTATLAVLVVTTVPLYMGHARIVMVDSMLTLFGSGAIFAGFLAEEASGRRQRAWYVVSAASAGLGTLVKGPIGLVLPALVLLAYVTAAGRHGAWRRAISPLNVAAYLAITLPWLAGVYRLHPEYLRYLLVEETVNRFASAAAFRRSEPWHFYLWIVAATFFPWSLLLPEAAVAAWRRRRLSNRADTLCLVWGLVVVAFFTVSRSKLSGYILTAAVAFGILCARLFAAALDRPDGRAARLVNRAVLSFGAACLVLAAAAGIVASRRELLARWLHIPVTDAGQLGSVAAPVVLSLAVFGMLGLFARWLRRPALSFLCLAFFTPVFLHVNIGLAGVIFEARSARQLAREIGPLPAGTEMAAFACYPDGLSFYLARTMTLMSADGRELSSNYLAYALRAGQPWPAALVRLDDAPAWLASRRTPIYIIARGTDRNRVLALRQSPGAAVRDLPRNYIGVFLPRARLPSPPAP